MGPKCVSNLFTQVLRLLLRWCSANVWRTNGHLDCYIYCISGYMYVHTHSEHVWLHVGTTVHTNTNTQRCVLVKSFKLFALEILIKVFKQIRQQHGATCMASVLLGNVLNEGCYVTADKWCKQRYVSSVLTPQLAAVHLQTWSKFPPLSVSVLSPQIPAFLMIWVFGEHVTAAFSDICVQSSAAFAADSVLQCSSRSSLDSLHLTLPFRPPSSYRLPSLCFINFSRQTAIIIQAGPVCGCRINSITPWMKTALGGGSQCIN